MGLYTGRGYDRVVDGSEPAVVDSQEVVEEDTEVAQDDGEPCRVVEAEDISRSKKARWWAVVVLARRTTEHFHALPGCALYEGSNSSPEMLDRYHKTSSDS